MASVRLENLTKCFNETIAVNDVSFEIPDGELITLLGPSGCGKTTILRMIAGLIEPNEGKIYFNDEVVNDIPAHKRNTAMVFQSYALFPHMTVEDNIGFGLELRKEPKRVIKEKVQKALELVGLDNMGKRYPRQLSGGQQQRVALARALVMEPKVLLLDEPLSNLDAKLREKMRYEIRSLQKRLKITTIYVTHDQLEALALSDKVAVINQGKLEEYGSPFDIYHQPKTKFIANFIGKTNLIKGWVESKTDDGKYLINIGEGRMLQCVAYNNIPKGQEILISIRPENIQILRQGEKITEGYNHFETKIETRTFLGNIIDYQVRINNTFICIQGDSQKYYDVDEKVQIAVNPDDCHVLVK